MKNRTVAERLVEALKARGLTEVKSPSRKYRAFITPQAPGLFYFVGKAGALRTGQTVTKSFARPYSRQKLLESVPA